MENPLPLLSLLALGWKLREDARRLRQERVRVRMRSEIPKPSAGVVDRATRSRPQAWVGSSALRREPRRSKEASGIC